MISIEYIMNNKGAAYKKRKLRKRERWDIIKIAGSSFTLIMISGFLIFHHLIFLYLSVIPPIMMAFPRGRWEKTAGYHDFTWICNDIFLSIH
jgi:hypothetical protein